MTLTSGPLPAIVIHADWSVDSRKRWLCEAAFGVDGSYYVSAPRRIGALDRLFADLAAAAPAGAAILAGFDFPFGVPVSYADRVGITDFRGALARFGRRKWHEFYDVAERPYEISPHRPFFPLRPGRKGDYRRSQLVQGLGVMNFDALLRRVDRPTANRPEASVIFWTLGAKQVGKATIIGWRDLVAPALASADFDVALWPFDGTLGDCLASAGITIAEAYPAEYYRHLALPLGVSGSKRRQQSRRDCAAALTSWARAASVCLAPSLRRQIFDGFGAAADGEDSFDAVVGVFGLLNVVLGKRPPYDPLDAVARRIEGWILGQRPED